MEDITNNKPNIQNILARKKKQGASLKDVKRRTKGCHVNSKCGTPNCCHCYLRPSNKSKKKTKGSKKDNSVDLMDIDEDSI